MKATDMKLKPSLIILLAAVSARAYEVNNLRHGSFVGLRNNAFDFNPSGTSAKLIFTGPNALERILSQSIGHSLEQGIITGSGGHHGLVQGIGHSFEPSTGHLLSHSGVHGLQPALSPGVGHSVALNGGMRGFGRGFEGTAGKGLQQAIVPSFTRQIPHGGARGLAQGFALGVPRAVGHTMGHRIPPAKAPTPTRSNAGQAMYHTVGQAGSYGSSSSYGLNHGLMQSFQPNYGRQFTSSFRRPVHDDFAFGESKVIHGPTYLVHTFGTERDPYYSSQKSYSGKRQRGSKAYVRKAVMLKEKTRHRH